ncbi:MAG: glycosyltransferase family 4 protein [Pyrinomonadaceae bacterium]
MRILYLHHYFITRFGVGGTRSYEFARYLVDRGHKVTMVTASGAARTNARGMTSRRQVDGIDVVEVRAGYTDYMRGTNLSYGARILQFIKFALISSFAVLREPKPDVIFATSPPLTIGISAVLASKVLNRPLVFEVRDLWPEAPIQMGALSNGLIIRLARWLERTIYRNSSHVVALSPGIREGIVAAGMSLRRISMIPNAADLEIFSPETSGTEFRARLGVNGQFVCSYFGAMGEANDLTQVVEAAKMLHERGERNVVFVLHGNGKRRPELEAFCRANELSNVIFSEPIADKYAIASLAAASDVSLTIYKNLPVLYTCSPNKLFDTFAAGRPAIVNSPGWLKELVEENEAGLYARPDDAGHLAERVLFLRDHPEMARSYGRNARRLAEQSFDRNVLAAQLLRIFEELIQR